jgi:hypothetical protein
VAPRVTFPNLDYAGDGIVSHRLDPAQPSVERGYTIAGVNYRLTSPPEQKCPSNKKDGP